MKLLHDFLLFGTAFLTGYLMFDEEAWKDQKRATLRVVILGYFSLLVTF